MPVRALDPEARTLHFVCTGWLPDGETRCGHIFPALPLDAARVAPSGTIAAITCPACGSTEYFHTRLTQAHVDEAIAQATTHTSAAAQHTAQAATHAAQADQHRQAAAQSRKRARGVKTDAKRAEHDAHAATHMALATDHATHAAHHQAQADYHNERAAAWTDRAEQVHHARLLSQLLGVQRG